MQTIEQRALTWIFSEDTGSSSKSICAHMLDRTFDGWAPSDTGDLGRCLRLLALIPEWAPRIKEMAAYGPAWAGIVEDWDRITHLYFTEGGLSPDVRERSPETYTAMKVAIGNGYRNDSRYECSFSDDGSLSWCRLKYDPETDEFESELPAC